MKRLGALAVLLAAVRPALAHQTGQQHSEPSPVPPVLFLAGVFVLGTTVYLDYRDMLSRRLANVGVGIGVLAVLAGLVLLFVA